MEAKPRRRKVANPQPREFVKASVSLDVETSAKLSACAALRRTTKSAIIAEALSVALKGMVAFDRSGKSPDRAVAPDQVELAED